MLRARTMLACLWVPLACSGSGAGEASGASGPALTPSFQGPDAARPRVEVRLEPLVTDLREITDVQFPPGGSDRMVVLGKRGTAWWVQPSDGSKGELFTVAVSTSSEQGLLGLAFHPRFAQNGLFYLNYTVEQGTRRSIIAEWQVEPGADLRTAKPSQRRVLLEVEQPYVNHDAGQLQFGPDGYLYVGFGDGGSGGDPKGHGQDPSTLLGSMLRIDVDREGQGTPYAVPADNPFVGREGFRPETWAYGLRNPWRYSFAPDGRLIVADVGQDRFEEIDIVERGGNYGWDVREGRHCFEPPQGCPTEGLIDPIYEYGREEGVSVTGGYVATGDAVPALKGRYVFGDFGTGRIWALELPEGTTAPAGALAPVSALGMVPFPVSTFGRDAAGDLYVADYSGGTVYRLVSGGSR